LIPAGNALRAPRFFHQISTPVILSMATARPTIVISIRNGMPQIDAMCSVVIQLVMVSPRRALWPLR
jgi:hypothetical protein